MILVSMIADYTHRLLAALLMIGGVELNPGPKCQYANLASASNSSECSSIVLPRLLSQPAFLLSNTDIVIIQQEVAKCRQEILNKSDELCEKANELNVKDKLLAEKEKRICDLLEMCNKMNTTLLLQETKIVLLEEQKSNSLIPVDKEDENQEILELKYREFEKEIESLECKVADLREKVKTLAEENTLLSEKLSTSENVVPLKLSMIASCQEGDWRSAVPMFSQYLAPDTPAHQQLLSVQEHRYCLAEAAAQGHVDIVREFLVHGFPPDTIISHDGTTMLHRAAWNGRTNLVELLLNYRAPVDSRDSVYARTALMYAALGGHEKTLTYLLDNGASISAVDGPGWSALHLAAMMGHASVVWHLVTSGADISLQSRNGQTPEDIARQYHKDHVVMLLSHRVQSKIMF